MAAVDVSRVVALANKAVTLESRGHWARAAEIQAEAVAAAQALHQPDCIIVADMQASQANALLGHTETAGVTEARRVELLRSAFLEVLPPAMASLERRKAAGTLLAGACRPHEVAWGAAKMAHAETTLAANVPNAAGRMPPTAAEMSAWSAYVGYDAYVSTARIALQLCAVATHLYTAQMLNLQEATAVACSVFVESAFDMIQLRTGGATVLEAALVRRAQFYIEGERRFDATNVKRMARAYPHRLAPPAEQRRAAAARHHASRERRRGTQHARNRHRGGDCSGARPALLHAAHLWRARGARLALQALLSVFRRRLLLQGAPSAGLACAQSSLPRGAQGGGGDC
jgi:hypothetical protein